MRTVALVVLAIVSGVVGAQRMPDSSDPGRRETFRQKQERLEREERKREEARWEERQWQRRVEQERLNRARRWQIIPGHADAAAEQPIAEPADSNRK